MYNTTVCVDTLKLPQNLLISKHSPPVDWTRSYKKYDLSFSKNNIMIYSHGSTVYRG